MKEAFRQRGKGSSASSEKPSGLPDLCIWLYIRMLCKTLKTRVFAASDAFLHSDGTLAELGHDVSA